MRIYLSLILTAIALSFVTAYLALNLQKDNFATFEDIQKMKAIEVEFQATNRPIMEFDLSSMYPTRDYFQLIQPILPTFNEASRFSKRCGRSGRMTKNLTNKVEVWESFRCLESKILPESFFERSPYIHESGVSYAYLAVSSGRMPFNDPSWIKKHLNYFHLSELSLLPFESLDENFRILSIINPIHLEGIINGDSSLLTEEYYLVRKSQKRGLLYSVYSRLDFDKFLNKKPYYAKSLQEGETCFYSEGSICWQKDSNNLLQMLRPSSIIIFGASLLILFLVLLSLYSRIRMQNKEEERKRYALRVLTHELRTPIANLLLQIESINKQSDSIDSSVLEELLKMEGEVYRLKRLAEKSSSYLNSQNEKELINFDYREFPSVNEVLLEILEDYKKYQIEFSQLNIDEKIRLDPYWFSICIKNLIENSIHHGAAPIKVRVQREGNFIRIDVQDAGNSPYHTLDELINVKNKKVDSKGLGMGLGIVQRIMKEMDGKLVFSFSPKKFSLLIRSKQ
jgi:hypothetical protein